MSRRQSWESLARQLGERLTEHAACPTHVNLADGLAADCPHCEDRWAVTCTPLGLPAGLSLTVRSYAPSYDR